MVQDTRKDPRAKVLTMTVRYKSATIDEFIEHHSHDVSRGGIYIKTPSPFPPGTLLKFEIRIAEDQSIIGGVGRVVWKRDAAQSSDDRPSGMGVKFLKIDENSRKVIDRIVDNKGDVPSAFDESDVKTEAAEPAKEEPAPVIAKPVTSHKTTMLGLGAVTPPAEPEEKKQDKPAEEASFFPKTDSEKDMPPPEERTVMKQAAELLAEALKGAGGSMEEIGAAPADSLDSKEVKADKPEEKKPISAVDDTPIPSDEEEERPEKVERKPSEPPKKVEPKAARKDSSPPPPKSEPKPVKSRPAPVQAKAPPPAAMEEEEEGGSLKILLAVAAAVVVLGGIGYFVVLPGMDAGAPATTATTPPLPEPTQTVAAPEAAAPTVEDAAEPTADAAAAASASAEPPPPTTTQPPPPPPTTAPKPPPPPKTTTAPKPPPPPATTTAAPKPPPPKTSTPKPPPPPDDDNPY